MGMTEKHQNQQPQRDVLALDGGIRLVLVVMRRHGLAVAIQEYGVGLLASILKLSSTETTTATSAATACREFVDEEGISTVLAAMMIHPDHAAVQACGCDVLARVVNLNQTYKRT